MYSYLQQRNKNKQYIWHKKSQYFAFFYRSYVSFRITHDCFSLLELHKVIHIGNFERMNNFPVDIDKYKKTCINICSLISIQKICYIFLPLII